MRTKFSSGFTLIELLVSVALGLIVIGSVLALTTSMLRANAQTIATTRLTQELRAVSEIVARELRRARFQEGTILQIGRGSFARRTMNGIAITGECVTFAYENAPMGNFRSIRRRDAGGRGEVVLSANAAANPGCAANGLALSSEQIDITQLTVVADSVTNPERIDITIAGRLAVGDSPTRSFVQSIRVRSSSI